MLQSASVNMEAFSAIQGAASTMKQLNKNMYRKIVCVSQEETLTDTHTLGLLFFPLGMSIKWTQSKMIFATNMKLPKRSQTPFQHPLDSVQTLTRMN